MNVNIKHYHKPQHKKSPITSNHSSHESVLLYTSSLPTTIQPHQERKYSALERKFSIYSVYKKRKRSTEMQKESDF
jgi:hypothetical protein